MYKSIKGFRAISKHELEAVLYYYRWDIEYVIWNSVDIIQYFWDGCSTRFNDYESATMICENRDWLIYRWYNNIV